MEYAVIAVILAIFGLVVAFVVHTLRLSVMLRDPKHLTYSSLEAWAEGERLPKDWTRHPDAKQRDIWWKEFAELKQHLWEKHIASLSGEERTQFADRTHPSLSHRFKDRADPFIGQLKNELARLGYTADVQLGFYHLDRIVLSASLDKTPARGLRDVPWLFRGFEIKYRFPDTQTTQLNQSLGRKP